MTRQESTTRQERISAATAIVASLKARGFTLTLEEDWCVGISPDDERLTPDDVAMIRRDKEAIYYVVWDELLRRRRLPHTLEGRRESIRRCIVHAVTVPGMRPGMEEAVAYWQTDYEAGIAPEPPRLPWRDAINGDDGGADLLGVGTRG